MGTQHTDRHRIAVVGFPYIRENAFAVFRQWPAPDIIRFLLPERWSIKGGTTVFTPPDDPRVSTARAYFANYHWAYPVIGGLLKGWMPAFPKFLWRNRKEVDLDYACSEPVLLTTLYYAICTRLFGKKLVLFTWENIPYKKKFSMFSWLVHGVLVRINLALAHGLVCGNQAGAAIHSRFTRRPIAVIPMNGLEVEQFRPRPELRRDSPLGRKVVFVFVGAIGKRKGIHVLLGVFTKVLQQLSNAHLIIAGSGEYEREIERLTNEPFLRDHITRFPWLNHHELVRLLAVCDIFMYPSMPYRGWEEQFGYSMAEASLMELPVIATTSGSIAEVVRDGETGLLVAPGDEDALADAMIRLGSDGALQQRLGRAGRQFIESTYSNEIIARKMYDFFNTLA